MFELILGIALKAFGLWLGGKANAEASSKAFLAFIDAMNKEGLVSVKIRDSIESQLDRLMKLKQGQAEPGTGGGTVVVTPPAETTLPKQDANAVVIVVPPKVAVGVPFAITVKGFAKNEICKIFADKVNFVVTLRWNESIKAHEGMAQLNTKGSARMLGVQVNSVWIEKALEVV